jgi:hypothetical protein
LQRCTGGVGAGQCVVIYGDIEDGSVDACLRVNPAKLRGLAERYKDDNGQYIVCVLTTHDLNSATIKDVSELLYQLGKH